MNLSLNYRIFQNRNLACVFAVSLIALLGSYLLELGAESCKLCRLQRYCFSFLAMSSILGILSEKKRFAVLIVSIGSLANLGIGIYHLSVQFGLVMDPCMVKIPSSLDSFKQSLFSSTTSCSAMLEIFGVPVSFLSVFFSILCIFISAKALFNNRP
jgi:disulfide bond formation protein DsbB